MSVNSKMTAIADEIRELSSTTGKMGLDAMATNARNANVEVGTQSALIAQIIEALDSKAGSSGVQRAAGTFTPDVWNETNGYTSINCGFKPDVVYITEGLDVPNYDSNSGTYLSLRYAASFAFTEGNTDYILSQIYDKNNEDSIELYVQQNDTGFKVWLCHIDSDYHYSAYLENFNYIAVKYTDVKDAEAVYLPTLTNQGTSEDLTAGKQLIDADGNIVFGSKIGISKTTTTKLSSNSTTITFTGLTAQPKMFSITPTGDITLGSTRYVTGVSYDGETTHGTYGYRSSQSGTSYYSSSYFTWSYNNGTLTMKSSSSTNGGNFSSSVTYQLTYVVEDTIEVDDKHYMRKEGTLTTSNGEATVNCGFVPDIVQITLGTAYGGVTCFNIIFIDGYCYTAAMVDTDDYCNYYVEASTLETGFELYNFNTYTNEWTKKVSDGKTYRYVAIKYI